MNVLKLSLVHNVGDIVKINGLPGDKAVVGAIMYTSDKIVKYRFDYLSGGEEKNMWLTANEVENLNKLASNDNNTVGFK